MNHVEFGRATDFFNSLLGYGSGRWAHAACFLIEYVLERWLQKSDNIKNMLLDPISNYVFQKLAR